MLDPDFRDIGASGRLWTCAEIIASLAAETAETTVRNSEVIGHEIADHLVLLTYVSDAPARRARRTSLWRFDDTAGWRLLHHQGTLIG